MKGRDFFHTDFPFAFGFWLFSQGGRRRYLVWLCFSFHCIANLFFCSLSRGRWHLSSGYSSRPPTFIRLSVCGCRIPPYVCRLRPFIICFCLILSVLIDDALGRMILSLVLHSSGRLRVDQPNINLISKSTSLAWLYQTLLTKTIHFSST
jgi:hypothetical protein